MVVDVHIIIIIIIIITIIIIIVTTSLEVVILTLRNDNKLHQNSSSLHLTKTDFSPKLIDILLPFTSRNQFIHNEVKRMSEYDLRKITKGEFSWCSDE